MNKDEVGVRHRGNGVITFECPECGHEWDGIETPEECPECYYSGGEFLY